MSITSTNGVKSQHPLLRDSLPRNPANWRNPDPRPCEYCGKVFWHRSFHLNTSASTGEVKGFGHRRTCSLVCKVSLAARTRGHKKSIGHCKICGKVCRTDIGKNHIRSLSFLGLEKERIWCTKECLRSLKKQKEKELYYLTI